ncbi:centromere protein U [Nycticebus coucang]|uniref:centromere protein U n=1 Tax=Nycticebus coucang TaxID=9470 RepID=UPI00234C8CA7|nr:centromere protein U [Nycticebus coucang]
MAPPQRMRRPGRAGERYSKNTLKGRTHPINDETDPQCKPPGVFDFPDNSGSSKIGRLDEIEKDEEPYETFDPPLHSTAIYADEEEFSKHCRLSIPSTPPGQEARRLNTSQREARESKSVKISAKKPRRKLRAIRDKSESTEESEIRRKVKSAGKTSTQQREALPTAASSEFPEKPAESVPSRRSGRLTAQTSAKREVLATESQQKTQEKGKMSSGKRERPRSEATDSGTSDVVRIWCLEGKKISDIMELDIVLPALEKTLLEYEQRIESKICKKAINKFYFNIKEELIKMLKDAHMLKKLKRRNAKMISDIEKKRQRLVEVQDELLRLKPELRQLKTRYTELKERKSSLRSAAYFLSNLKQLYRDYSDVQGKEPKVKETYDSSSLPALLFNTRTVLGAETHLQNINHQLEKLLDQE